MRVRLSRIGVRILRIVLLPIVATLRVLRGQRREEKPALTSSIDGDPLSYTGDRPLVIAVWADWATVWQVVTRAIVQQLQHEFAGRCEFAYVDASRRTVRNAYGTPVVPTLILRQRGAEISRFVNVVKPDDIRSAIAAAVSSHV